MVMLWLFYKELTARQSKPLQERQNDQKVKRILYELTKTLMAGLNPRLRQMNLDPGLMQSNGD